MKKRQIYLLPMPPKNQPTKQQTTTNQQITNSKRIKKNEQNLLQLSICENYYYINTRRKQTRKK